MVMVQTSSRLQTITSQAKLIFEEAINFQKALVKRDQSILRNKKEDSQVSTNYCDWKPKLTMTMTISRGGVEDTRLEARTQKKIRSQGQPFRGQTLLRPRTGMLEAKVKDKGTSASVLQKKKGVQKSFSGDLKKSLQKFFQRSPVKTAFSNFFSGNLQNFNNSKLPCPRLEDKAIFEDLRPRGQGQGLQNVSPRMSSRPRTSSRTPPLTISLGKIYPKCKLKGSSTNMRVK